MRCSIAILTLSVIAANLLAQVIPSWWSSRNVFESGTSADDFVAVNQGQLKTFAEATVAEFNARFPGGAGNTLNALVASWSMPAAGTDDYQVVTVGQLKALGDLFYQRIEQIRLMRVPDWSPIVPSWSGQGMNVPGNADVVNIGQVKELFNSLEGNRRAFVTGGSDNLSDTGRLGLSWWMDSDDDGHSDLEELLHGSNPDDATAQPPMRLELVSGNGQWIGAAEILAAPVVVAVKRGYASLAGMQVLAALPSGTDVGSLASAASGPWQSSITLTTDTAGQARIWWKAPSLMAPKPYAFFARLSPVSAGTQISLFANARPADPSAPLTLARGESTVLSKPVGSLTLQTLTLVITRSGLIQAGIPTRLTVHGEGGRIALSPQGPWRQQIDAPTGADGRIACHWRSSRSQPGSGSVRVSVPGQTTEPTTLIIPTTSQLPYVLTVLSGPALLRGAGSSHALPVLVLVTQGGAPVKDATVHLSVSQTGGQISSTAAGPWGKSVTMTTDIQGQAQAWWRGESTVAGGAVTVNLPDQPAVAPVTLPSATTPPDTNDDPNSDGLSPTQRLLGRLPYEITVRRQVVNVLESGATGIDDPVDEPTEGPLIRTTKHKYGPENFPGVSRSVQVDEDTTFREGEESLWWQRPDKLSWELGSNKSYDESEDEPTQTYGWNKSWRGVTFEFRIRPKAQAEPGAKLVLPYLIETLKPNIASYLPQTVISSESGVLELVVNGQPDQEDKRSVTCVLPYEGNNSDVKRMRVRLLPVDLDIVHPATGELDEGKQHDATKGGIVAIRRDDQTPVTKLVIRPSGGLPSGSKFKLQFSQADRYKIWKDEARAQAVTSGQTEFDPSSETTLYLEGLKRSTSRGGEEIKLQLVINGTSHDAETVKLTVTEAEFDVFAHAFIPYQWVAVPLPYYSTIVAHGDDRDYDPTLKGTFRMQNTVTVIPFEELSSSPIKQLKMSDGTTLAAKSATCGETKHFHRYTSLVDPGCVYVHEGEPACPNNRLSAESLADEVEGTPYMTERGTASTEDMDTTAISIADHIAKVRIDGSAGEPIVFPAEPIDYSFTVSIDSTDPLNPKFQLSGEQDGFPAYEVYVRTKKQTNPNQGSEDVTPMYQWKPAIGIGVEELLPFLGDVTIEPAREGNITLP